MIIGVLSRRRCELSAANRAGALTLRAAQPAPANAPSHAHANRGGSRMSRLTWPHPAVTSTMLLTLTGVRALNPPPARSVDVSPGFRVEGVATRGPPPNH